jgi:Icc-related predicted phosphoesterase
MRIVALSDTHGLHDRLTVPECDVLIHAGDFSTHGRVEDTVDFLRWFEAQPARHRVLVAGNHDLFVEAHAAEFARMLTKYPRITYLQERAVTIDGVTFYGSPITPKFFDWAFMRERGKAIRAHWDAIPDGVDVLITHGPPYGIADRNDRGDYCGCEELADRVFRVEPRLHIFGHIHEGRGEYRLTDKRTSFVNVASINRALYQPVAIDLAA